MVVISIFYFYFAQAIVLLCCFSAFYESRREIFCCFMLKDLFVVSYMYMLYTKVGVFGVVKFQIWSNFSNYEAMFDCLYIDFFVYILIASQTLYV